jgi:hypothetical protein
MHPRPYALGLTTAAALALAATSAEAGFVSITLSSDSAFNSTFGDTSVLATIKGQSGTRSEQTNPQTQVGIAIPHFGGSINYFPTSANWFCQDGKVYFEADYAGSSVRFTGKLDV